MIGRRGTGRSRRTSPTCGRPTSPSCCATSASTRPCSRADIAASTGLNKATVSSLVADLIDRRLLRETGLTENRIGRPATMLMLDGRPYAAVGIEVAADHLTAVAVDLAGERLLSWRRAFPGLERHRRPGRGRGGRPGRPGRQPS